MGDKGRGMIWPQSYINKIICGDCISVMKQMPDECVDMVITSPPYNIKKDYGEYKDNRTYKDYLEWLDSIWNECFRILINGGRIAINVGDTGRNPYYPVHCDISSRMRMKWWLRGIVIWNKQNCLSNTAWGSWKSASNPCLRGLHEFIVIGSKNTPFLKKEKEESSWTKRDFLKSTLEIWNFTPETLNHKHPAPFPEELPARLIKLYSYIGDIILDPFVGSGTTARVAKDLKRSFIGIEINPEYCKIAEERLAQGVL